MPDGDPEAPSESTWETTLTRRERVQSVVELLDSPTTIETIAEAADVEVTTAEGILEELERYGFAVSTVDDGEKQYVGNPVKLFFEELRNLVETNTRDELERQLVAVQQEQASVEEQYDNGGDSESAAATLEALETERTLLRHAVQLSDDVANLEPSFDAAEDTER